MFREKDPELSAEKLEKASAELINEVLKIDQKDLQQEP